MYKNPLYATFEQALVDARLENALTQSQVAARLGKPQSYVSKYESGERRLDVVEFLEVCKSINIKPDSIIEKLGAIFDF